MSAVQAVTDVLLAIIAAGFVLGVVNKVCDTIAGKRNDG
jgi:hypothetical protein